MKCISPIKLKKIDEVVACGRCNFCLQKRRKDWAFRLFNEYQNSRSAFFLTLTYDDDHIMYGSNVFGTLVRSDLQRFHKSVKRNQSRLLIRKYGKMNPVKELYKIKYYGVGEYGSKTMRPHYHSIMFNLYPDTLNRILDLKLWNKGHIQAGGVTHASIDYVCKYVIDRDMDNRENERPFAQMSKGIGENYLIKNYEMHKKGMRNYVLHNGVKQGLPRYYKDKIFEAYEKDIFKVMATEEETRCYFEELERITRFGVEDPRGYIKDRVQMEHDKIKVKSEKLNTI